MNSIRTRSECVHAKRSTTSVTRAKPRCASSRRQLHCPSRCENSKSWQHNLYARAVTGGSESVKYIQTWVILNRYGLVSYHILSFGDFVFLCFYFYFDVDIYCFFRPLALTDMKFSSSLSFSLFVLFVFLDFAFSNHHYKPLRS